MAWSRRAEETNPLAFAFDSVLAEPLGWYLFRLFLRADEEGAESALDFVADVQSYSAISTPSLRLNKAAELVATYFKQKGVSVDTAAVQVRPHRAAACSQQHQHMLAACTMFDRTFPIPQCRSTMLEKSQPLLLL